MWVFDSTPLIYLAKAERLSLLANLDDERLVPKRVYDEVVTAGLDESYPDARRIQRRVDEGLFTVETAPENQLFERLRANEALSGADRAVLALAAARGGIAVTDEQHGREVARTEGIQTRGTAYLLLSIARDGHVSPSEIRSTLETMLDEGWYCSPDLYAKLLAKLESFD